MSRSIYKTPRLVERRVCLRRGCDTEFTTRYADEVFCSARCGRRHRQSVRWAERLRVMGAPYRWTPAPPPPADPDDAPGAPYVPPQARWARGSA